MKYILERHQFDNEGGFICPDCDREFINKGAYVNHIKTCEKIQDLKDVIRKEYLDDFVSIPNLANKYNLGKVTIKNIIGKENTRTLSDSGKIAHKLYPDVYKHSDESKAKMRQKRLEFMKKNPEKTAWRQKNMSYIEQRFLNKLEDLGWNKKYNIIREKSFFPFFVDFAFINEKMAVELDGSQHDLEDRKVRDIKKDDLLKEQGWKVIRIPAINILKDLDNTFNKLDEIITNREKYTNYNFGVFEYEGKKIKKVQRDKRGFSKSMRSSFVKQRKIERPPYEQLLKEIEEFGYLGTGRKYGVSDASIRKWKKYYEKDLK